MIKKELVIVEAVLIIALIILLFFIYFEPTLSGFATFESQPDSTSGQDTYIKENFPTNYGSASAMEVGKTAGNANMKSLIKFDLSSISTGSVVTSGVIRLYVSNSNTENNITVKAYRITSNWTENEAIWTNRTANTAWTTAGGDYSAIELTSVIMTDDLAYYNFTLTDTIRGWINGTYANYGIILISTDASAADYRDIETSESETAENRPKIFIDYTATAIPTVGAIVTDTDSTYPKQIGQSISFNISWNDLDSSQVKAHICNTSTINITGCDTGAKTFCSTSLSTQNPIQCSYTSLDTDNKTSNFFVSVCDAANCSTANQSYFYVNHLSNISLERPNGGETINQTQGNYNITFNVSDTDNDALTAGIYYSETQGGTEHTINSSANLSFYCTDSDSKTSTLNNCTYFWNTTSLYGTYYLTIILNDTFSKINDSSDSAFDIRSLVDSTPPGITSSSIDSTLYSGRPASIYAVISESNIHSVWAVVNTTPQINVTMSATDSINYNGTFTASSVANYTYKVYARDTVGNLNDSMAANVFSVIKPVAIAQSQTAPSTVLPFAVIKIETKLNATIGLRDVHAYLTIPEGFTFLSDYPQNTNMGNFSNNETKTATWFLSVPLTEANYTMNVTYTDYYSNSWNTSNFYASVSSSIGGGYTLTISGYPEIQIPGVYHASASFSQSGGYVSPDSMKITIIDSSGNTISSTDMTPVSTGIYNYSYSVGSGQATGQWQTIINATKSSVSYYAGKFWKVVGALFDVGNITVVNSDISSLDITVTATNVGNTNADLELLWNLTRTDNDALLASAGETFAVGATPVTRHYYPSTSYVGQVKIVFIGRYSGTEYAAAYKIFSTTSENVSCGDGTCNGAETCSTCPADCGTCPAGATGGGGGGGASAVETVKKGSLAFENLQKDILLTKNLNKIVKVNVKNIGNASVTNLTLSLPGLEKNWYTIAPNSVKILKKGESAEFSINFLITEFMGEAEFYYKASSNEASVEDTGKITVLSITEYFIEEIKKLREKLSLLKENPDIRKSEIDKCEELINLTADSLSKENFIDTNNLLKEAENCINEIKPKEKEIKEIMIIEGVWIWVITWALILILIIILIVIGRIVYKKMSLTHFIKKQTKLPPEKSLDKDYFDRKIENIQKKIGIKKSEDISIKKPEESSKKDSDEEDKTEK